MGSTTLPTTVSPAVYVTDAFRLAEPRIGQQITEQTTHLSPNAARFYDAYLRFGTLRGC